MAGELNINLYNGQLRLQIILSGIRLSTKKPSDLLPDAHDFADIYRYLRTKPVLCSEFPDIIKEFSQIYKRRILRDKFLNALNVFQDLKILTFSLLGDVVQVSLADIPKGTKVSIDKSEVYQKIKSEILKG